LWALDDLHWADDSTWEFVRYAARRVADLALVLAVTYRDEEIGPAHPWWPGLLRLKREPGVLSLPLARLSADDGERIVRAVDPGLPQHTVIAIVERSAGTPLLVEELASLASRPGDLAAVPDIVQATVRERAGRLDPAGRALLEVAAVAGLEVDAGLLAAVVPEGQPGDLVAAGLLNREDERFRFRHPLLQEAAYDDVPDGRRRALHEQIAAAMAKSGSQPAERVAAHLERAGRPEAALSVFETAAEEASRAGQVGRVATLHLGALQLARRHRSLTSRRVDLENQAIEYLHRADRSSELEPLIRDAWPRRDALPDAQRARLAAAVCTHQFWTESILEASAVATDELMILEDAGGLEHGTDLLRQAALIAWFKGDGAAALALVDRAVDVARRTGDLDAELRACRLQIVIAYGQNRDRAAAVKLLRENADFARAHGLAMHLGWASVFLAIVTGRVEDVESARQVAERIDAWFWQAARLEATLHLMEGRRDVSEAVFGQLRRELQLGTGTIGAWIAAKEACLYLHRGDLDEARSVLEGSSATADACSFGLVAAEWSASQGWLAWEEGRFQEACAYLASAGADSVIRTYATLSVGPAFIALRTDALVRLGQHDEAAAAISQFETFKLSYDRFMAAALAAARFRLDPTFERASNADMVAGSAPWPWLQALVGCWRGEFLQETGAATDACERFEAIGAPLGILRAQAVLRGLGVRVPRQEHATGVLSPREIEVADLVAEGLSNPAIARRLYLSRPTVASHVAHILTKLGFSSRVQIAAWVAQRRVAAP
jgi:DNA-binding CsgD family transcriptional regulator